MKWITREKAKVDRIACPWLIRKFVDSDAEFVFLPHDTNWSAITNGTVFDVPNAELGHQGTGGPGVGHLGELTRRCAPGRASDLPRRRTQPRVWCRQRGRLEVLPGVADARGPAAVGVVASAGPGPGS